MGIFLFLMGAASLAAGLEDIDDLEVDEALGLPPSETVLEKINRLLLELDMDDEE